MAEIKIWFGDEVKFPKPMSIDPAPCPYCGEQIVIDKISNSPSPSTGNYEVVFRPRPRQPFGARQPVSASAGIQKLAETALKSKIRTAESQVNHLRGILHGAPWLFRFLFRNLYADLCEETNRLLDTVELP